ncbi:MAG TPA: hypothetical protein VFT08_09435 [Pyrinomonadaceae bacterium]|nr:hypothetical protein [Pyrinomonadaceae bacterium]
MKYVLIILLVLASFVSIAAQETREKTTQDPKKPKIEFEYKLLATNRVTTMEKEMNDAAAEGYRFMEVISGDTFFGGSEALVVMVRPTEDFSKGRFTYQLLATTKTGTMQKELQAAGDQGYEHVGQSVFKKTFGTEVMVILERDNKVRPKLWEYKLLATKKTSTMQKEVMEAAAEGYQFVGFSTGSTFFGGNEVVTIMRRPRADAGGH